MGHNSEFAIKAGRVFCSETGINGSGSVLIKGNKIESAGPDLKINSSTSIIDFPKSIFPALAPVRFRFQQKCSCRGIVGHCGGGCGAGPQTPRGVREGVGTAPGGALSQPPSSSASAASAAQAIARMPICRGLSSSGK